MNKYIDSHVHLWDISQGINSWIANAKNQSLNRNYLLDDYLKLNPQAKGIVTVEAADGAYSLSEVMWLQPIARNCAIPMRHIAYIDMLQPVEKFVNKLKEFAFYDFVRGFRHIMSYCASSEYSPCSEDITLSTDNLNNFKQNLAILASYQYIFNCQMYPEQLLRVCDIILASGVQCVVDHCGLPRLAAKTDTWNTMIDIYKKTKVNFKLSGFDIHNNDFKLIIDKMLDKIAPESLIFGSNYPFINLVKQMHEYIIKNYGVDISNKILYTNANELFFS
jgi:predicted TIM-barrel fold metal-dependent hydrolase